MKANELANRYAKALYEISSEKKTLDAVMSQLRGLETLFAADGASREFLVSPMVTASERENVLQKALTAGGVTCDVADTILLLARNDRFAIFPEFVTAFQNQADLANNVCRGSVRSATTLGPDERGRVESTVERVLKKKVILTYKVDPTVIGGLVAQVGSYTFDDSIDSHLKRMNEELKRRTV